MSGTVITVASLKGGSGKSTLASCLGVHWKLKGWSPALVDADPQRSIARTAVRGRRLAEVPVVEEAGAEVWKKAREMAERHSPVIIDTPGFRSEATIGALAAADLVLIPVKPSPMDVDLMMDTVVVLMSGVKGWAPTFRCVLTQTTRDSIIARHIRSELESAGFPLLRQDMPNRVAYGEAALYGATPTMMNASSLAAQNIAAIATEVETLIDTTRAMSA